MRMISRFLLILALFGSGATVGAEIGPTSGDSRPEDRAEIRTHIDSIFKAYMEKDEEKVRATHADEWRGFLRASNSIVRGIDEYMREALPGLKSPARLASYEMVDFDVVFYGDLAIVPYIAAMEFQLPGDVRIRPSIRVLDIYAKQGGHWIQVASQTATHPETLAAARQQLQPVTQRDRGQLLAAREALWRAWFSDDRAHLEKAIPPEVVAIDALQEEWQDRSKVIEDARLFAAGGARLVNLEFSRTEIQRYGDVAILYTLYEYTTEKESQSVSHSGRATEMFVKRGGEWVNVGWHLDTGPGSQ